MSFDTHRIALIQMAVRSGDLKGNISHATAMIGDAAEEGASLALLPECLDLGWCCPSCDSDAGPIPDGPACRSLIRAARENSIHVCAGITEKAGDRIYNAAVLIDPQGKILLHHRKIHELEFGRKFYSRGDRLGVVDTELGVIGLMICADGFVDDLAISRTLGQMGAEMILSPCAWAVPSGHDNELEPYGDLWRESYRPIANEFGCAILGASNVGVIGGGEWNGRPCIGCSLVIGRGGEEVLQGPYGPKAESVLYVDLVEGVLSAG